MNPPSSFFLENTERLLAAAARGPLLDLACGRGRHTLPCAARGAFTVGMDRSPEFLAELRAAARTRRLPLAPVRVDLESDNGIPVLPGSCGAILVFRFLYRPLAAAIEQALAPGGLLLYETFTLHQRNLPYGPSNPAFLLQEGELRQLFPALETLHTWEGQTEGPRPDALARLLARKAE